MTHKRICFFILFIRKIIKLIDGMSTHTKEKCFFEGKSLFVGGEYTFFRLKRFRKAFNIKGEQVKEVVPMTTTESLLINLDSHMPTSIAKQ